MPGYLVASLRIVGVLRWVIRSVYRLRRYISSNHRRIALWSLGLGSPLVPIPLGQCLRYGTTFAVQSAAVKIGYREWFHDYARDDVVITEKDVAMAYQYLVQLHGMPISMGKTIPIDFR